MESNAKRPSRQRERLFKRAITVGLVAFAALPIGAGAQTNVDGKVYGTAKPNSTLQLRGVETGQTFTSTSDGNGEFRFNAVPPGKYTITTVGAGGAKIERTVVVKIGQAAQADLDDGGATRMDDIEVVASSAATVDVSSSETSFDIGEQQLDSIPVPRSVTGVALLAPGTIAGDNGFAGLPSFGGSTASENQYYLNGYNISDLRTRLGPANVPFEFFQEFDVKTGGYSAEFGRSTGGVVNAVSKRGTNVWTGGMNAYLDYEGWSSQKTSTADPRYPDSGTPYAYYYGADSLTSNRVNLQVGGPILRDRLFIYALGELRRVDQTYLSTQPYFRSFERGTGYRESADNDPFGAIKIDWQIAPGHALEYTGFSDARTRDIYTYNFDRINLVPGDITGKVAVNGGGVTQIARYTGQILPSLTVSALYGTGTNNTDQIPSDNLCPSVTDSRTGTALGCFAGNTFRDLDKRKAYRFDVQWDIGDLGWAGYHTLRVGADQENNESSSATILSGGAQYEVLTVEAGNPIGGTGAIAPDTNDYIIKTLFSNSGTVEETLQAYYLEDTWQVTSRLTASLGARMETFENKNTLGQTFIDLEGDLAPRLGLVFDVFGDASSKLYANYGRYYIPLGTQATVRNGTAEFYKREAYRFEGYTNDRYSVPIEGEFLGDSVTANGDVKDPARLVSRSVEPSYQDEYILGYEMALPDAWVGSRASAGIRYIYRDLGSTLEDIAIDQGLNAALNGSSDAVLQDCDGDGSPDNFACGFDFYFITNPGNDVVALIPTVSDTDTRYEAFGSGPLREISLPADLTGYEKPDRQYHAVELTFEKFMGAKGYVRGSYTWSQSFGNYEGFINSTIEQEDVAITQDFDQPGFLEGANGFLANDRRHKFKLFGSFKPTQEWDLGAFLAVTSGRPVSALGFYRDFGAPEAGYAQYSFYTRNPDADPNASEDNPVLVSRGSAARTPWVWSLDLSVKYMPNVWDNKAAFGFDVFNVFNNQEAIEHNEISETLSATASPLWNLPTDYQDPRRIRAYVEYKF